MHLLLLGPPGVGKGTQAALLAAQLGLTHLASGDLLRRQIQSATRLGLQAQAHVSRGDLVPDAIVIAMILDQIGTPHGKAGMIFDGFPRTIEQADALVAALRRHQRTLDGVICLRAPREVLVQRIAGRQTCGSCGRSYNRSFAPSGQAGICDRCGGGLTTRPDDTVATVQRRLEVYGQQTLPLVEHFRRLGLLHEVDGDGAVAEVARRICHTVTARISPHPHLSHPVQRTGTGVGVTFASPG